mgnify:CR=1 FL=1
MLCVTHLPQVAACADQHLVVSKALKGKATVSDARTIDTAVDAWAMEYNKLDGEIIDLTQAALYSKTGQLRTNDRLGNPFEIGRVGTNQVQIATTTKSALAGVSIDWGAY